MTLSIVMEVLHHVRQMLWSLMRWETKMNEIYERTTALGLTPKEVDDIACVAHEAVKAWARSQSDFSHEIWSNCSAEHKHSMRLGVLRRLENPDETAETNHETWRDEQLRDGWTWGQIRDEVKKQNPAMVPYSELPVDFRKRNEIFMGIVKALDPRKYR